MQPVFRAVSTSCHAGQGLAGHPRCVRVGNGYDKTRLYTPIRSKTTTLPQCACHHSAQRGRSILPRSGDESAEKMSHRNRSFSPERVRLLQPLLPHSQKRWRPATYSRSQTPESCPGKKVIQDDPFETDHVAGSERCLLSYPGSPPSQTILEIRIRIQCPPVWAVPGSLHFYAMHGCGSLLSATDGNSHTQLPRRLAHSGPVRGSFNTRPSFSATYVAWGSGSTLPLGTVIVQMTATVSVEWATMIQRHMASFKEGTARPLRAFQKMLGLLAAASPVLQLGLFRMRPIQFWLKQRVPSVAWCHGCHRVMVTRACVSGLL